MSKLALVTGGSGGIGRCTIEMLRAREWEVLAPTRLGLDFRRAGNVKSRGAYFGRWHGALDALIFCHGTWYSRPISQQRTNDYRDQFIERAEQPAAFLYSLLPCLQRARGCVVMVASTQAFGGRAETGPYAAACAAQVRLMQGLAQAQDGIRYNVVAPGITATRMAAQVIASGDCRPDAVPQAPEAVARAIVGLVAGDENGVVLRVVDGEVALARWGWE